MNINPVAHIRKRINLPPDKSISHRALMVASIACGKTVIHNFLHSEDTLATMNCLKKLNVALRYERRAKRVTVCGRGMYYPLKKKVSLCAGLSGTTMRILTGILTAQKIHIVFDGYKGLRLRPMRRITRPLRKMGGDISGKRRAGNEYPPLTIRPVESLGAIRYAMPQASAQVKSAILFSSLYAEGDTVIKEPFVSRDHTERMLNYYGARVRKQKGRIVSSPREKMKSRARLKIPGDFSSAAFFIALGILCNDSRITLPDVGINPTRTGFLEVIKKMGGRVTVKNRKKTFEPRGDLVVSSSALKGVTVPGWRIPLMIDEVPILMVCAAFAAGTTSIYGLKELKVKETDRISSMLYNLRRAGVDISVATYGKKKDYKVTIRGTRDFRPADFKSFSDHRTAMSMIIFGMASGVRCTIDDAGCINKSFPEFIRLIRHLSKRNT